MTLELTENEYRALIAYLHLGMKYYEQGAEREDAKVLENTPDEVFGALGYKLGRAAPDDQT